MKKTFEKSKTVALAGNPNVGKSTVFNGLTGMNQHTGNWTGKTVENAFGCAKSDKNNYTFVDIPGTYSLMSNSKEEQIARSFLCFKKTDAVIVVCDATCLERNLNLALQIMEINKNVLVCVNLLDEAKRKGITVNLELLSKRLGVKVIGTTAKSKKSLNKVIESLDEFFDDKAARSYLNIFYDETIEKAIEVLEDTVKQKNLKGLNPRWLCLKILEMDTDLTNELYDYLGNDFFNDIAIINAIKKANKILSQKHLIGEKFKDEVVSSVIKYAELICKNIVKKRTNNRYDFDAKIDKILTSKAFGYPIMIVGLMVILWLTISGANYPSNWLSKGLFYIQDRLSDLLLMLSAPDWLHDILVFGVYRVVAWVVSVMLPPMAIFFPLFTLLEDSGFLPRVAYNLDKPFKKCNACGKQSLTMCMGFGCNAVGVTGCRIIDSKRERLLAILTNSFVPCNGRFPTLIAIISMFFINSSIGILSSCFSSAILTLLIVLSVFMTLLATYILSKTLLKGEPSSFTLELPSYRKPQFFKVFVRSIFDRTLFVLGRAVVVAAPAGAIIWLLANLSFNNQSLLSIIANFLNPFAICFGLDGVILLSFILGFPANEIVIPIIIMTYLSKATLVDYENLYALKELFITNGWTITTALCFTVFSLFHWPCSTTLITIKRETKSVKWTIVSAILPTLTGLLICFIIKTISNLVI